MPDTTSPDIEALQRLQAGDPSGLSELFDRHQLRLHRFFQRLARPPLLPSDLVQEVFVRVLKYHRGFRSPGSVSAWLISIARNVLHDELRRVPPFSPLAFEPEADGPGAPERIAQDQELESLRGALESLPDEQRELIVMARLEGLSHADLAELLDCTRAAVKQRLHRAVRALASATKRAHARPRRTT